MWFNRHTTDRNYSGEQTVNFESPVPFSKCLRAKIYCNMNVHFDPQGCQTQLLKESEPFLLSLGSWTRRYLLSFGRSIVFSALYAHFYRKSVIISTLISNTFPHSLLYCVCQSNMLHTARWLNTPRNADSNSKGPLMKLMMFGKALSCLRTTNAFFQLDNKVAVTPPESFILPKSRLRRRRQLHTSREMMAASKKAIFFNLFLF